MMATSPRPDAGLYRDEYERDSCGFGLIAHMDDQASHWLVETAIVALSRLTHRGAVAADGKTGDGCGLLLKRPTGFLRAVAGESGIELAERFAAGIAFLSRFEDEAERAQARCWGQLEREGLVVAGWRVLPTQPRGLRRPGHQDPAAHGDGIRELPRRGRRGRLQSPPFHGGAGARKRRSRAGTRCSTCRRCPPRRSSTRAW
jgi:hypothetical protein